MKKLSCFILLIFISALLLTSCIIKEGGWKDNIKLSTKTVEFKAQADSVIITSKGDAWWVCDITVNDNHFFNLGINPESDNYKIKQDCFIVERRDKHTLYIRLDENLSNVSRIVTVGLQAGDYFDRVTIIQNSK